MVLSATAFLIIFASALVVIGLAAWLNFHFENKKRS
jgi:hypothetical protein